MRLGISGLKFRSPAIRGQRFSWLACFQDVSQRKPGAFLALLHAVGRRESGSGPQKFLGVGLIALNQHEPEIEVGLENVGFGGDRLAVGGDRLLTLALGVVYKAEIEACLVVGRIAFGDLSQQRLGGGIVSFLNGRFSLF